MQRSSLVAALTAALLNVACGGGDDGSTTVGASPTRGSLRDNAPTIVTIPAAQIDASVAAAGLQALVGVARCDVQVVALDYNTVGVRGEAANSSGVLLLPAGSCAGQAAPLVAFGRGTEVYKPRTLANPNDSETMALVGFFAAQGYAVVAPDYLGYARSTYTYHPYLDATSEATTMVDGIRAARAAAALKAAPLSGRVMVTGYSQGGHVSMATHRLIERAHASEIRLVAAAHLAGPYNVSGLFALPDAMAGVQYFLPLMLTSWQKAYGNLYSDPAQIFNAPYASYIDNLLPSSTLTYATLVTTGALPGGPTVTPNQARDLLFSPSGTAAVRANPNHPVLLAARRNDLLGWNPIAGTLLCQGSADPVIPYQLEQVAAKADFDSRGLTNVATVDIDPYVQAAFGINGQAPTDPASAAFAEYYGNYHGLNAPPFCFAQAKAFFDGAR